MGDSAPARSCGQQNLVLHLLSLPTQRGWIYGPKQAHHFLSSSLQILSSL